MRCPFCLNSESKVIDKRDAEGNTKRRRECLKCSRRFNTHERVDDLGLRVVKRDDRREDFDRAKLKKGVLRACEKRPVSLEQVDKIVAKVENKLQMKGKEVKSVDIGELVSRELKKLDKVSYIRFASVYKDFTDVSDFNREIKGLVSK